MSDKTKARLAIAASVVLVAAGIAAAMLHPQQAQAVEWRVPPSDIRNPEPIASTSVGNVHGAFAARQAEQAELEAQAAMAVDEAWQADYAPSYGGMYYAEYSDAYNTDGPSRTMPGWHDGYLETYYNASRHYLASTWTLDSEGFYRDADGRYVIGVDVSHANEMPYGTVVQTGKGEAVVYDYGSGAEVHDFATNW